jgi:Zn2+/Cd2+-exporting ATPase
MLAKYHIKNLDCANCADKIEHHLKSLPCVKAVSLNFATLSLHIDTDNIESIRREIKKIEPGVEIVIPEKVNDRITLPTSLPKKEIVLISLSLALFLIHLFFENRFHALHWIVPEYAVALTAYFLAGGTVLFSAFSTVKKGRIFDENVLMTIATLGAFCVHALGEAIGVMLFFKVGELLQNAAVSRSRKSIQALLEVRPDVARLKTTEGVVRVSPDTVKPGDSILVKAGEKIPLDGIVTEGSSLVNTSALTGESAPVAVKQGSVVVAGEINMNGLLTIRVTKLFADSSIVKMLDLVENANAKKAKTEQFIATFARSYTPIVVFLALGIAAVPPLLMHGQSFLAWIYRALVLLVISCPCALVISIPLGYFGGIGAASRRGILVKGSSFIDALAEVKTIVFDKTGTLTNGTFTVKEIVPSNGYAKEELLSFAAIAESNSTHPIAQSICLAAAQAGLVPSSDSIEHRELGGFGVMAKTVRNTIFVGNDALLHRENIAHSLCDVAGTVVHVVVDGKYAGHIIIGDHIKDDAAQALSMLRKEKIGSIIMLTGDNKIAAKRIADQLDLDSFQADLTPENKLTSLETILAARGKSGKVAFVGDGINDAPVLARADVGIAMGAFGSEAAIETADVVLMTDHPSKVAEAIRIGKKTKAIIRQNIILALGVKIVFISFGALGLAGMWEAVFADMGTALLAVLNSTRALSTKG